MNHLLSIEELDAADHHLAARRRRAAQGRARRPRRPATGRPVLGDDLHQVLHPDPGLVRSRHPRTRRLGDVPLLQRHPARPRRTDRGHRPGPRTDGPRRHHPDLRPAGRGRLRRISPASPPSTRSPTTSTPARSSPTCSRSGRTSAAGTAARSPSSATASPT